MFNIFLSDLHNIIELGHMHARKLKNFQITSISWADDLLIMSLDRSDLQKCINNVELYAKECGLVVSMKKTRCVIFSKGSTNYTNQHQFIYGDQLIRHEKFYKYLGVEITNNCEFKMVREQGVTKARNAIFSIRKALATSGNVSVKLALSLFDSKIEPVFPYGSIISGIESNISSIIINGPWCSEGRNFQESVVAKVFLCQTILSKDCHPGTVSRNIFFIKFAAI